MTNEAPADTGAPGDVEVRITSEQYPEIIQAARWMDEDNGTPHFEPGVGFIVDDPEGLTVPVRWVPHLISIEAALAGLDHKRPHPLDEDTIRILAEEGRQPTVYDSAAYCFVAGEHTPVTAMATSSRGLFIANRFFNERFEDWEFDPGSGYGSPTNADGWRAGVEAAAKVADQVAAQCAADEQACDVDDQLGADYAFGGKIEAKRIAKLIRALRPATATPSTVKGEGK